MVRQSERAVRSRVAAVAVVQQLLAQASVVEITKRVYFCFQVQSLAPGAPSMGSRVLSSGFPSLELMVPNENNEAKAFSTIKEYASYVARPGTWAGEVEIGLLMQLDWIETVRIAVYSILTGLVLARHRADRRQAGGGDGIQRRQPLRSPRQDRRDRPCSARGGYRGASEAIPVRRGPGGGGGHRRGS